MINEWLAQSSSEKNALAWIPHRNVVLRNDHPEICRSASLFAVSRVKGP
jgi:hypothetical protein